MKYQKPDYSDWGGVDRGYKQPYACMGKTGISPGRDRH